MDFATSCNFHKIEMHYKCVIHYAIRIDTSIIDVSSVAMGLLSIGMWIYPINRDEWMNQTLVISDK